MTEQFSDIKADVYKSHRDKSATLLKSKHIRQFDREFLKFADAGAAMSVLELGCGTGLFLRYLKLKKFGVVVGVDYDENLLGVLDDIDGAEIVIADAGAWAAENSGTRKFDRIVLFDIIEHLELDDILPLLRSLREILSDDGKIVLRVPNVSSPWGLRMHFGSFDHVTPFTPGRVHELAHMTGFECIKLVGQMTGKRRKRLLETCLHFILNRVLTYHPEIWQANMLCLFAKKPS